MESDLIGKDLRELIESFPFSAELAGKTVMVSGATGLIGSLTVRFLQALGRNLRQPVGIIALVRDKSKAGRIFPDTSGMEIVEADLASTLPDFGIRADYIIHCASPTSSRFLADRPVETIQTIFEGTRLLLDYALRVNAEGFVYLSSLESYGVSDSDAPVNESFHGRLDPMTGRSSYPVGKLAAECLCHAYWSEYGVPVKVARLTQVLGAGVSADDNRVFAQFARAALEQRDIVLHTEGQSAKPYCYTTDAISAIFHILFRGKPGEAYNVANEQTYISIRSLADFVVSRFAPECSVSVELRDDMGYAPPTRLRLDTQKLRNLGWQPRVDLPSMFERLISYFKNDFTHDA